MVYCEWRRPRCAVGMLSVFGPPMEGRARAAMQFLSRLKDVLWWWRVEPVLSCWMCPGRGFCVEVSSAESCSGGQLPVWRCLCSFQAFRLVLWLCCDSVAPHREEPSCLQTYDTDP